MKVHLSLCYAVMTVFTATSSLARDIKIINFNIWHGMNRTTFFNVEEYEAIERRGKRFSIFAESSKLLEPDILIIQEANKIPAYVKNLSKALDYGAVWRITNCGVKLFGLGVPSNFSEGLAVLAKKEHRIELIGSKRISGGGIQSDCISFHTSSARYIMAAKVTIDDTPLLVFNIHAHFSIIPFEGMGKKYDDMLAKENLPEAERKAILNEIASGYEKTENEILQLLPFVKETTAKYNYPYIIAGDFNTTDKSPAVQKLIRELDLIDAFSAKNPGASGFTWDPIRNPNARNYDGSPFRADGKTLRKGTAMLEAEFDRTATRRIDFILFSRHFTVKQIKNARIVFNEPKDGLFPSDHFDVEVVLDGIPK